MKERDAGKAIPWSELPERYLRPGDDDKVKARGGQMTTCRMCKHEYSEKRERCNACGHPTPRTKHKKALRQPRAEPRSACVFCRLRGAKARCPQCGNRVHPTCQSLHKRECDLSHIPTTGTVRK